MIARFFASAIRRPRLLITLYIIALARAAWPRANVGCHGDGCQQGDRPERCNCGLAQRWATTSDPMAWVKVDGPGRGGHVPPRPIAAPASQDHHSSSVMRLVEAGQAPAPHRQMTVDMWRQAAECPMGTWIDWMLAVAAVALLAALAGYMSAGS